MQQQIRALFTCVLLSLYAGRLLCPPATAETLCLNAPSRGLTFIDAEDPSWWAKALPDTTLLGGKTTFNITYLDPPGQGFNDASLGAKRRACFEEALTYLGRLLNVTGELDVEVDVSQNDGSGFLAAAGTFFYTSSPGFSNGLAFIRLRTGEKNWENPEVSLQVDFGWPWYYDNNLTPAYNLDLKSVLIHECLHALGIATHMDSTGQSRLGDGVYTVWDSFVIRGSDYQALINGNPPVFVANASDLISNNLYFGGPNAYNRYAHGDYPGIYAPATWALGSSIAHWDQDNIIGGGVMEPQFAYGETKRLYRPVDIGGLFDMGYTAIDESKNGFQLTTSKSGQGSLAIFPTSGIYAENIAVSLTATPATGWVFSRWEGHVDDTTDPTTTITMRWHETIKAIFEEGGVEFEVTPDGAVDFGNIEIGAYTDTEFTIENTGAADLSGAATTSGSAFSVVGVSAYDLSPTQSLVITVRFAPETEGAQTGSLSFSGGDPLSISLTGAGQATGKTGGLCGPPTPAKGGHLADTLLVLLLTACLLYRRPATTHKR